MPDTVDVGYKQAWMERCFDQPIERKPVLLKGDHEHAHTFLLLWQQEEK
jgi:hypothetical protein